MTATRRGQILLVVGALLCGVFGSMGYNMYQRHNLQHWQLERALEQQMQINREFAQAINSLAARSK